MAVHLCFKMYSIADSKCILWQIYFPAINKRYIRAWYFLHYKVVLGATTCATQDPQRGISIR